MGWGAHSFELDEKVYTDLSEVSWVAHVRPERLQYFRSHVPQNTAAWPPPVPTIPVPYCHCVAPTGTHHTATVMSLGMQATGSP